MEACAGGRPRPRGVPSSGKRLPSASCMPCCGHGSERDREDPRPRGGGGARDKLQTACHAVYQKGHEPWRNDTVGKDHGESGWFAILDKVDEGDLCLGGDIGAET